MEKIIDKLDNINVTLDKLTKVLDKPQNPILQTLTIIVMVVSAFGIVAVVDVIIKWFFRS